MHNVCNNNKTKQATCIQRMTISPYSTGEVRLSLITLMSTIHYNIITHVSAKFVIIRTTFAVLSAVFVWY
jgi:hypothetical protein